MNIIKIGKNDINYQTTKSEEYNVKIDEGFYVEKSVLTTIIFGEIDLPVYEFYHSDNPQLEKDDYFLSDTFKRILTRFPHTNTEKVSYEEDTYVIKHVPVFVRLEDYLAACIKPNEYDLFFKQFEKIKEVELLDTNIKVPQTKLKQLKLDGTFGVRQTIASNQSLHEQKIQHKLVYGDEFYGFGSYSYAGFIEFLPEYGIKTYDEFHEQYGKYIYSMVLKRNDVVVPLLWPDYLYHRPENHLEFGVLSDEQTKRYELFNDWTEGDKVQIELLAEGFEDVQFTSYLKKKLLVKPKRTKESYLLGEQIEIELSSDIVDEIRKDNSIVEVMTPNGEILKSKDVRISLKETSLCLQTTVDDKTGHYQIRIHSNQYGQLLIVATLKKKKE